VLVEFDEATILDSDGILDMAKIPATLVVVGAGVIGIEYASIFAALGTRVTVVERNERLLEFCDNQVIEALQYYLRDLGLVFRLGETVTSVEKHDGGTLLRWKLPEGRHQVDHIVGKLVPAFRVRCDRPGPPGSVLQLAGGDPEGSSPDPLRRRPDGRPSPQRLGERFGDRLARHVCVPGKEQQRPLKPQSFGAIDTLQVAPARNLRARMHPRHTGSEIPRNLKRPWVKSSASSRRRHSTVRERSLA